MSIKNSASKIGSSFLTIQQSLTPLRVACAGGHIPVGKEQDEPDNIQDEEVAKKKRPVAVYSKYANTSKLKLLLKHLELVRSKDATCKF